jgi:hypothetical protein
MKKLEPPKAYFFIKEKGEHFVFHNAPPPICLIFSLLEQDIHNLAGKLAKETYKKYENDAKSVRMWVT